MLVEPATRGHPEREMPETLHQSSGGIPLHVHERRRLTGLNGICPSTRNVWSCASPGMRF